MPGCFALLMPKYIAVLCFCTALLNKSSRSAMKVVDISREFLQTSLLSYVSYDMIYLNTSLTFA